MNIKEASKYSINNRKQLQHSKIAGCYSCCEIFSVSKITEWTDGDHTAFCPFCSIYSNRIAFREIRRCYFFSQQSKKPYCNGLLLAFLMQLWIKRTRIKIVRLFDLSINSVLGDLSPYKIEQKVLIELNKYWF